MLVRMWSKGNTHPLLVGLYSGSATMEIRMAIPQQFGINLPQVLYILLLYIYPKDIPSYHKNTCSTMLIADLLIISRNAKQPEILLNKPMAKEIVVH